MTTEKDGMRRERGWEERQGPTMSGLVCETNNAGISHGNDEMMKQNRMGGEVW